MKNSLLFCFFTLMMLSSCKEEPPLAPLQTVPYIDLERFMGDWYVIAAIPTFLEKGAVNGIERYRLREDGDVDISYTFHQDSVQGKQKQFSMRGFVVNRDTNSEWKVQFLWPIRLPYYVIELDTNYSFTVVGVPNRKNVWLMSRQPNPPDSLILHYSEGLRKHGYDPKQLQPVPQIWSTERPRE